MYKQKNGWNSDIWNFVKEKINFGLYFAVNQHFQVGHALLRHCDVIRWLIFMILVSMERGDPTLYHGTKQLYFGHVGFKFTGGGNLASLRGLRGFVTEIIYLFIYLFCFQHERSECLFFFCVCVCHGASTSEASAVFFFHVLFCFVLSVLWDPHEWSEWFFFVFVFFSISEASAVFFFFFLSS